MPESPHVSIYLHAFARTVPPVRPTIAPLRTVPFFVRICYRIDLFLRRQIGPDCIYRYLFFAQGQAYQDSQRGGSAAAVGGSGSRLGIRGTGQRDPRFSKGLAALSLSGRPRLAGRWRRFHKTKSFKTNCQIVFQAPRAEKDPSI